MQLIQNGQNFVLGNFGSLPDKLPLGTYTLLFNKDMGQYYLHLIDDIRLPEKIYGDVIPFAKRVCVKYNSKDRNLGVLLVGTKGAGKTITARAIASLLNTSVIIIPQGYDDTAFISFLTDPALGNCVILIDEFEKLYNGEDADSNKLLSLLDGPYNTHHIFVFTANEFYRINSMMKNRPSRIHFLKEFTGLDEDTVRDIGNNLLDNKDWTEELVEISQKMTECTFDVVTSICADSNLFKESPKQVVRYMNVLMESSNYEMFEERDGTLLYRTTLKLEDDGKWNGGYWVDSNSQKTEDGSPVEFYFDPNMCVPDTVTKDERIYDLKEHKVKIVFKRKKLSFINYVF